MKIENKIRIELNEREDAVLSNCLTLLDTLVDNLEGSGVNQMNGLYNNILIVREMLNDIYDKIIEEN